jgi:hypothetical protein
MEELDDLSINVINDILGPPVQSRIDESKISYDYYRSYDFWQNKFPKGWEYIPGFEEVIKSIHQRNLDIDRTPLKEIEERSQR